MDRQRYIEEGYRQLNDTSVCISSHATAINDIEEGHSTCSKSAPH